MPGVENNITTEQLADNISKDNDIDSKDLSDIQELLDTNNNFNVQDLMKKLEEKNINSESFFQSFAIDDTAIQKFFDKYAEILQDPTKTIDNVSYKDLVDTAAIITALKEKQNKAFAEDLPAGYHTDATNLTPQEYLETQKSIQIVKETMKQSTGISDKFSLSYTSDRANFVTVELRQNIDGVLNYAGSILFELKDGKPILDPFNSFAYWLKGNKDQDITFMQNTDGSIGSNVSKMEYSGIQDKHILSEKEIKSDLPEGYQFGFSEKDVDAIDIIDKEGNIIVTKKDGDKFTIGKDTYQLSYTSNKKLRIKEVTKKTERQEEKAEDKERKENRKDLECYTEKLQRLEAIQKVTPRRADNEVAVTFDGINESFNISISDLKGENPLSFWGKDTNGDVVGRTISNKDGNLSVYGAGDFDTYWKKATLHGIENGSIDSGTLKLGTLDRGIKIDAQGKCIPDHYAYLKDIKYDAKTNSLSANQDTDKKQIFDALQGLNTNENPSRMQFQPTEKDLFLANADGSTSNSVNFKVDDAEYKGVNFDHILKTKKVGNIESSGNSNEAYPELSYQIISSGGDNPSSLYLWKQGDKISVGDEEKFKAAYSAAVEAKQQEEVSAQVKKIGNLPEQGGLIQLGDTNEKGEILVIEEVQKASAENQFLLSDQIDLANYGLIKTVDGAISSSAKEDFRTKFHEEKFTFTSDKPGIQELFAAYGAVEIQDRADPESNFIIKQFDTSVLEGYTADAKAKFIIEAQNIIHEQLETRQKNYLAQLKAFDTGIANKKAEVLSKEQEKFIMYCKENELATPVNITKNKSVSINGKTLESHDGGWKIKDAEGKVLGSTVKETAQSTVSKAPVVTEKITTTSAKETRFSEELDSIQKKYNIESKNSRWESVGKEITDSSSSVHEKHLNEYNKIVAAYNNGDAITLQRIAGTKTDGKIGPKTEAAVQNYLKLLQQDPSSDDGKKAMDSYMKNIQQREQQKTVISTEIKNTYTSNKLKDLIKDTTLLDTISNSDKYQNTTLLLKTDWAKKSSEEKLAITKAAQKELGVTVDGMFGTKSIAALRATQQKIIESSQGSWINASGAQTINSSTRNSNIVRQKNTMSQRPQELPTTFDPAYAMIYGLNRIPDNIRQRASDQNLYTRVEDKGEKILIRDNSNGSFSFPSPINNVWIPVEKDSELFEKVQGVYKPSSLS